MTDSTGGAPTPATFRSERSAMSDSSPYDVLGIGFGPSNIALAVAMRDTGYPGRAIFLEAAPSAAWQHGMLLSGSDIQHNPFRDFSTPVNPQGYFTFANYLHQTKKFFRYLNVGLSYAYRVEFAHYVDWVKAHFTNLVTNGVAERLELEEGPEPLWKVVTREGAVYRARKVVVGTGRPPRIPNLPGVAECRDVIHLTRYLYHVEGLAKEDPVVVIGGSQSAAEIVLDLLRRGFENVHLVHRSFSLQLKDTSPFSDEVYFPEFVDYYHRLSPEARRQLSDELRRTNYSSVDRDVLDEMYRLSYQQGLVGRPCLAIHRNHEVTGIVPGEPLHELHLRERYKADPRTLPFRLAIFATGFLDIGRDGMEAIPRVLHDLTDQFEWEGEDLRVARDYSVAFKETGRTPPPLYLNGLCEATHGMGDAGSFSLVSLRARDILTNIVEREAAAAHRAEAS